MAKKINIPKDSNIIKIPLEEAMPENYLPYAVEVARDRALPDVRDGLKPVHRRIIYGSYMLKAFPDKPYYKSARIVGDILGKYHPHGDSSVYESMVILAQNFTTRHPLIDGHGNWGSVDGDSAAAMRYTEARLTPIALEMINDIDKDVVDMVDNYSGSEKEPSVLPAAYPNLLVNGAFGIAVGLSTNIPPHNLREVIDAVLKYIDNKDVTVNELMECVKGPDLPTGGIIIGKNSLIAAYETGEGKVTLRARTKIERLENGRLAIVISEFPYRRNKAKILQTISEMTADKKHAKILESISDIRDESDRRGIRGVIEFKKSSDEDTVNKILKYLFKKTELQCNINFNMVALADGKPETMGLKTIIGHYVNHRKDIVTRRTKHNLNAARKRFNIVEGFIKAIDIMDEIISTIRASKSKKDSENNLVAKFGFNNEQATAIVELMLYKLTGLEIETFKKEYDELSKLIKKLEKILSDEKELLRVVKNELKEVEKKYGEDRRTSIVEDDSEAKIDVEEFTVVEDIVVTMSNDGYIKSVPKKTYLRSNSDVSDIEYREGDFNRFLIETNTAHNLLMFTDEGNMYKLRGNSIPEYKWKEKGEKIDNLIKGIDLGKEKILNIYSVESLTEQKDIIFITDRGSLKKTSLDKFDTIYSKIMALKLKKDEKLIKAELVLRTREEGFIKVSTEKGLDFTVREPLIEEMDRNKMGHQCISVCPMDRIVSSEFVENDDYRTFGIQINKNGIIKTKASSSGNYIDTTTSSTLLIFIDDGRVINIPSYMFKNMDDKVLNLSELYCEFNSNNKIIKTLSIEEFNENKFIYFFSSKGFVKKTKLSEFVESKGIEVCYKLRNKEDMLVNVDVSENEEEEVVLITKKAMGIKFLSSSVSVMGKIASGVTGISLNEEDITEYGFVVKENLNKIILKSKLNDKIEVEIEDIKVQNRGGKGKNLTTLLMTDFISEIKIK
ncbi:topoisomerase-4 subunit A [Clostridium acetobutylicum]|uniref:DNA topoisomerase (ATP-hydrolyzing) n=1 Tax=Clostridium acetobutylicum (strain ATCC 824 / DSM 792 / JCM 1419 / IAM 19013 / LMG 5710 / NBRC 13948 / NRRL B-527 / VKM B-1787 / 2291 / W) TaxID=272562 RepID=Q97IL2_CLOAB|nr:MULTISPECIES: DNA topoisomerase IV subunit A [Clostridium]AAK79595.1 DNA gyrase A subunit [Clostridium acetobutylicum ATCC 824]ADZ20679.1 DNA topoisomerase IV subunit A [Clostridium acetobutylicum EA 2018]AEI31906.1 DNA topoisomerase IV subunit A [Clostridium acetobutylicum DSM 1731]AWV79966.1 DNA topoisomerase IV subunit A [Clostridium acetobutylicum]MBC2394047.1 DNA topoisomerase IV subunit A [Clostridium acetobutylicum]